jgi:hypothetical protein
MQVPCEQCNGTGRVPWAGAPTGAFVIGSTDKPCPECAEKGYFVTGVSLADLRALLNKSRAAEAPREARTDE